MGIASRQTGRADLILAILLTLLTAAVFSPVLGHQFIEAWDDSTAILTNPDYNPPRLANLAHYWLKPSHEEFYVPVTYTLWGLLAMAGRRSAPAGLPFNPAYFYAANLAAHALCAGMVYLILRRLVTSRWPAFLAAAVFALHPIQVEAVANAWSLYTPLSALFGFVAIWEYLEFSDRRWDAGTGGAWRHYAFGSAAFILAMLTKPTAVTVPLMIGIIEVGLRHRPFRPLLWNLGPWLVLAPVFIALNEHSAPPTAVFVPPLVLLPLVPLDAIAFYLGKFFRPTHLTMDYGRTPFLIAGHPTVQITCLLTLGFFLVLWALRKQMPWLLTAFLVFVAGVLPTIGIVPFSFQFYSTVADRYVYLGMFGLVLGVAFVLARLPRTPVAAYWGFGLLVLTGLACLSVRQLRTWQDDWTLGAYTLAERPKSPAAAGFFKYLLTPWGHRDLPGHPLPASTHCSLDRPSLIHTGDLLRGRHYFDFAEDCYRLALAKGPPDAEIYDRIGLAQSEQFMWPEAVKAYRHALVLNPTDTAAKRGLAIALDRLANSEPAGSPSTVPARDSQPHSAAQ